MNVTFFDIETAPLPLEVLNTRMPVFEANGTLKDPVKVAADIILKKQKWLDDAALSPVTGQVLVIGALVGETVQTWSGDEKEALEGFWFYLKTALGGGDIAVGFCIHHFDLPFLIKRSWSLGVKVPYNLLRTRYWSDQLVDLQTLWQCGDRQCGGGLDTISRFFGGTGKNGNGKDFAKLWSEDQPKALEYLTNDLRLTKQVYERMCL